MRIRVETPQGNVAQDICGICVDVGVETLDVYQNKVHIGVLLEGLYQSFLATLLPLDWEGIEDHLQHYHSEAEHIELMALHREVQFILVKEFRRTIGKGVPRDVLTHALSVDAC